VNCHTLTAPAELQMKDYNVAEGVTCSNCHGPYQHWEKPHANDKVGANPMRATAGFVGINNNTPSDPATAEMRNLPYSRESAEHKKLFETTGLYDTRPIIARAQNCVGCHLKIDSKLVAAGHPQPQFELAGHSKALPPHWRNPGGYFDTKVWLAGQAVCLESAADQLNDRVAKDADAKQVNESWQQAMGHYRSLKAGLSAAAAKPIEDAMGKLKDAAGKKDKATVAAQTKAVSDAVKALYPKIGGLKMDADGQKITTKILAKLAKESDSGKDGVYSANQIWFSLLAVYNTYAEQAKPGDAAAVKELIDKKLGDVVYAETFKDADFAAVLAEIAGKVPADPGGGDAIE
jgi:hypothetical protein